MEHGGPKVAQILPYCAVNLVNGSTITNAVQESDLTIYKIWAFFKHTPKKLGHYGKRLLPKKSHHFFFKADKDLY